RGQAEGAGIHAEFRIDEHVELVAANRRRDDRGPGAGAAEANKTIRALLDRLRHRVHAREEVVDEDLEAVAIEIGNPALEIAAASAIMKKRRRETDAKATSAGGARCDRGAQVRCDGIDRA